VAACRRSLDAISGFAARLNCNISNYFKYSLTHVDTSTGSLNICYITFRTYSIPYDLQYSVSVLPVIELVVDADI
jgi:hypothetical protein